MIPEDLQNAANQGDDKAQFVLALLYVSGEEGVPQDDAKAAEWFSKAAEQGNVDAQYNLGRMYGAGQGVPQDRSKALELFHKAAAQGHEEAKNFLAKVSGTAQGHDYNNHPARPPEPVMPTRFGCLFGLLGFVPVIIGLFFLIAIIVIAINAGGIRGSGDGIFVASIIIPCIIAIVLGLLIIRWRVKRYSKKMEEYKTAHKEWERK